MVFMPLGFMASSAAPPVITTTWSTTDKTSTIALSNGNNTATSSGTANQGIRSSTSKSSGKVYIEFTGTGLSGDWVVGIANATQPLAGNGGIGYQTNALGFYAQSPPQYTIVGNVSLNTGTTASGSSEVIGFAIDFTNGLFWVTDNEMIAAGTPWNNSATANPATGVGGTSLSTLAAGPYFAMFQTDTTVGTCTANFGGSAFTHAVPSGFSVWG